MRLYKVGDGEHHRHRGRQLHLEPARRHGQPARHQQALARRRHHDSDRGRDRQPDDHRQDTYGNTVTAYTGSQSLTFSGAGAVGANNPTVTNSAAAAVNFGTATAISFTNGVATVSGSDNGVMRLYKAETANITVSEGGSYTSNASRSRSAPVQSTTSLSRSPATPDGRRRRSPFHSPPWDAYGNTETAYTDSQCLDLLRPGQQPGRHRAELSGPGRLRRRPEHRSPSPTDSQDRSASRSTTRPPRRSSRAHRQTSRSQTRPPAEDGSTGAFKVSPITVTSSSLAAATTTPDAGGADNLTSPRTTPTATR